MDDLCDKHFKDIQDINFFFLKKHGKSKKCSAQGSITGLCKSMGDVTDARSIHYTVYDKSKQNPTWQ